MQAAVSSPIDWKGKFFFSAAKRSFYQMLRRISPEHTVFAKVRLCDVLSASRRINSGRASDQRTQSKQLDFLICDATLAPVLAVELDDSSAVQVDGKTRDQFVNAALAAAAIPIVRIPMRWSYAPDDVQRWVVPHLHSLGPTC